MIFDFGNFENELKKHFNKEHHLVTEDLIRYWFIGTHSSNGDAYTEVPYIRAGKTPLVINANAPKLNSDRARADLYYGDIDNCKKKNAVEQDVVLEFKYHRCTRYSDCCTGTDCGSVFRDLNRLSILDNKEKYFVYVFDQKMKEYYDEKIKRNQKSSYEIFNIKNRPSGPIKVDASFDNIVKERGYGEVKKGAFIQFNTNNKTFTFDKFNYEVEVLYCNKITDITVTEFGESKVKSYYLVICRVS